MTWEAIAAQHIDTETARHRGVLLDVRSFRCLDCKLTLTLPREAAKVSPSGPPPYRRPDNPALRPMPAGLKEQTLAEIAARKRAKQNAETEDPQ